MLTITRAPGQAITIIDAAGVQSIIRYDDYVRTEPDNWGRTVIYHLSIDGTPMQLKMYRRVEILPGVMLTVVSRNRGVRKIGIGFEADPSIKIHRGLLNDDPSEGEATTEPSDASQREHEHE